MKLDLMPETGKQLPWQTEKFTSRDLLICDLHTIGKSNREIAEQLGLSDSKVSIVLGDARAHSYIEEQRRKISDSVPDVMQRLRLLANEALDEIVEEMRAGTTPVALRQKAALSILDRAGYTPVQKQIRAVVKELPSDLADRMDETLGEMKEISASFSFGEASDQ